MRARYFDTLHPAVSMLYFVLVLALTMTCMHPVMTAASLAGAVCFSARLNGWRAAGAMGRFVLPMFLLIAIANPLFNHRGVTLLFLLFDQWVTLEALVYGVVSGLSLAAVIYWFTCYQAVMTSDKFLYLFGKAAPNTALLITLTLRLIPQLQRQGREIREAQRILSPEGERPLQKLRTSIRNLSALLTWAMENAVETADSMKARGFGARRRTTFHLFRFDGRDARALGMVLALGLSCAVARAFGHGTMEYYPRMTKIITGESGLALYGLFMLLALLPVLLEWKEELRWRSCGLKT